MPKFANDNWNKHKLPLGIYTMQGFERRNKESKNIFRKHSNNKANPCKQIMPFLVDTFELL